jgi:hypothetical protein
MQLAVKKKVQAVVLMLVASVVAYASASGPEPGYTGAPADIGNCTHCHDTYEVANVGPGSVRIDNAPNVYTPGQDYTLRVTVQQAGRSRFGFQLTALDKNANRAGALAPLDGTTQVLGQTGFGGRQYIEHSVSGTLASAAGSKTWQVRWTAPDTDIGPVILYVAGNAANNDGTNQGDYIYTNRVASDSATSVVTVSLQSHPGGMTLQAGSVFDISWLTTGASNIDNIELRYSTDGGATFPISNLVFFTSDPSVTSYQWTVPNTPTTQAKLRVRVGKKSGDAVEVITPTFTILPGTGGSSPPEITGATVSGKKLYVTGSNFAMGAVVLLNGSEQKTANEDDFAHMLKCKKAGKKIDVGVPVTLQVKNPDGTVSDSFSFTRTPE